MKDFIEIIYRDWYNCITERCNEREILKRNINFYKTLACHMFGKLCCKGLIQKYSIRVYIHTYGAHIIKKISHKFMWEKSGIEKLSKIELYTIVFLIVHLSTQLVRILEMTALK